MSENEYIVTARKWRPLDFSSVVGQSHITQTLSNAIKSGRIHHAYLFTGPRGVGKTTTARIYAHELINYGIGDDSAKQNTDANALEIIEIDGASNNSVEDVRLLRENSKYPPSLGKYKIYIIDEVHMLSTAAFNALLKTLEEPPPHLIFMFATTEAHKLPATIISRCQRFDFRRMSIKDISSQLKYIAEKENIKIDEQSILAIAKSADGSMRDSQSIFDQAVAFCGENIEYSSLASALNLINEDFFFSISDNVFSGDVSAMFEISASVSDLGYDLRDCLNGMLEHFRIILKICSGADSESSELSEKSQIRYSETSKKFSSGDLIRIMSLISKTESELRYSSGAEILFELTLVKLAKITRTKDLKLILEAIKDNQISESPEKKKTELNLQKTIPKSPTELKERKKNNSITKTKEELSSDWNSFLDELLALDSSLRVLSGSEQEFLANTVISRVDNSFTFEFLKKKKNFISEKLNNFFSSQIDFRLELVKEIQEIKKKDTPVISISPKKITTYKINTKPETDKYLSAADAIPYEKKNIVEKFIIDEFGADEQVY
jgi:DNA polymerase III subunit gamma/tau